MQIANLIINGVIVVILLWVIFGFNKRMKTQSKILEEYRNMFEGTKAFLDFVNPKKLQETADDIVKLREEKIREETEKTIREIEKRMVNSSKDMKAAIGVFSNELRKTSDLVYSLLTYIPINQREAAINSSKFDSATKELALKSAPDLPYAVPNYVSIPLDERHKNTLITLLSGEPVETIQKEESESVE